MFTKSDTTKPTSWRKTVIGALCGIAAVAVGAQYFDTYENENDQLLKINLLE